jgi:hypothetical protein
MLNQVSLPRTDPLIEVAQRVAALRRGLLTSSTGRVWPTRRLVRAHAESYFEDGVMKRELLRL